jgi:hypothetical protein
MKNWILSLLAAVAMVLALAMPASVPAAPAPKNPQPAPAAAPAAEPHPEIREAIAALRNARAHMEHAAHDFGGHRVDALRATDDAIRQLEICLRYDR